MTAWMDANVGGVTLAAEAAREKAQQRAGVWHRERAERLRIERVMLRPVRQPVRRRPVVVDTSVATSSTDIATGVAVRAMSSEDEETRHKVTFRWPLPEVTSALGTQTASEVWPAWTQTVSSA